jgi:hypothetical protein
MTNIDTLLAEINQHLGYIAKFEAVFKDSGQQYLTAVLPGVLRSVHIDRGLNAPSDLTVSLSGSTPFVCPSERIVPVLKGLFRDAYLEAQRACEGYINFLTVPLQTRAAGAYREEVLDPDGTSAVFVIEYDPESCFYSLREAGGSREVITESRSASDLYIYACRIHVRRSIVANERKP